MDLVLHGLPKKVPKYVNLKHLGVEIVFEKFKKKLTSIKIVSIKNMKFLQVPQVSDSSWILGRTLSKFLKYILEIFQK